MLLLYIHLIYLLTYCAFVSQFIDWLLSITEAPEQSLSFMTIHTAKGKQYTLSLAMNCKTL